MALRRVSGVYLENFFSEALDGLHGRQGAMRRRPITYTFFGTRPVWRGVDFGDLNEHDDD
jgi:hypothetical protein